MSATRRPKGRPLAATLLVAGAGSLSLLGLPPERAISQSVEPVIRIEEDWTLVLNEPDDNVDSPQFHTIMAPYSTYASNYAQVLWNYRETPEFVSGGVQLQSYEADRMTRARSMEFRKLDTNAETITWTQRLETDGVALTFEVDNGASETWGSFGKDMRLSSDAHLPDLGSYDPEFSVQNSGVTYGSNRVDLMVITQVRYYGPSGLLSVDPTTRVVFERED